eukprot:c10247_g1_i1.p1 GENE.c10247_g1_i1~~c10247_g1_i1.p1  ORF type:complete len:261 (+),score=92.57 c10247_g1_i1:88-870(+)
MSCFFVFIFIVICFQIQSVILFECSKIYEAVDVSTLELLVNSEYIFFDIDETLVMPITPFIYGLPKSDAFVSALDSCEMKFIRELSHKMEDAYYLAPLQLVDPELPTFINQLRNSGKKVFALTSRHLSDEEPTQTQNLKLLQNLNDFGIQFSHIQNHVNNTSYSNTTIGTIFWAGSESANKGDVIKAIAGNQQAILIDNTLKKITTAIATEETCINGIHFLGAYFREEPISKMRSWVCTELGKMGKLCPSCSSSSFHLNA